MTFFLIDAASHVIRVKNQGKNRARQESIIFRIIMTSECQKCFHFRKFSYSVQKLIVDQGKLAAKELTDGDASTNELSDELICPVDCLFWRQYQLPCKHLWHYNIVFDAFQQSNGDIWAEMFENNDFEIYETSIKLKIERYEEIEKANRHMLQMKKILNAIKEKYYEIAEHTADGTAEERNPQMQRGIDWLDKLTRPIKKQKMEEALQKLKIEKTAVLTTARKMKTTKKSEIKRQRDEKNDDYGSSKRNYTNGGERRGGGAGRGGEAARGVLSCRSGKTHLCKREKFHEIGGLNSFMFGGQRQQGELGGAGGALFKRKGLPKIGGA